MQCLTKKIVQELLDVNGYITAAELSERIGVSSSSVKHNINNVKKELKKIKVNLLSVPKKGLFLEADKEDKLKIMKILEEGDSIDSFAYRKNYILDILFEYKSSYTIQLFSEELYTSRNIIQRDLQYIEKLLKQYELKLIKKRNYGITIEGNEFNIRQAIIDKNMYKPNHYKNLINKEKNEINDIRIENKKKNYLLNTYKEVNFNKIINALHEVEEYLDFTYSDISFSQIVEYIAISLKRIKQGNIIETEIGSKRNKIDEKYLNAAKKILKNLLENKKLDEEEVYYLAARLLILSVDKNQKEFITQKSYSLAKEFLKQIESIINNNKLSKNYTLIEELCILFERLRFMKSCKMILWDEINQDVKEQYSSLYGICLAALCNVEEVFKITFKPDDVARIVILIEGAIIDQDKGYEAILITASDKSISRYISYKISNGIKKLDIKEVINFNKLDTNSFNEDDLIISTIPVDVENAICISKEVSKKDIDKIKKELEKRKSHETTVNNIRKIFNINLLKCDLYVKNKEEVIENICSTLKENGYVDEHFIKRVWERENRTSTSIGFGIAIPHVFKQSVKKTGVSVVRLKYPLMWDNDEKVNIVILLAMDIDSKEELKELLKKIYGFIDDENRRKELIEAKDEEEMLKILKR